MKKEMGVLFDFNGTMFFDSKFQEISWRKFIGDKIGRDITDDEFSKYVHGRNSEFTLEYFLERKLSQDEVNDLEEEKEVIYRKLCLESNEFMLACGLPEFLDELVKGNTPINIATASGYNNVIFFFEHLKLDKWFELNKVVYNDGTVAGKPEPDIYLLAAKRIGVPIEKCVIFEDSTSGIEAGIRAGAESVVAVNAFEEKRTLFNIADYKDERLRLLL